MKEPVEPQKALLHKLEGNAYTGKNLKSYHHDVTDRCQPKTYKFTQCSEDPCSCQLTSVFGDSSSQVLTTFANYKDQQQSITTDLPSWSRETVDWSPDKFKNTGIRDAGFHEIDSGNPSTALNMDDLHREVDALDDETSMASQAACQQESRLSTCAEEARMDIDYTVEDLAGYFNELVHIPRNMSAMAEMMYT